MCLIILISIRVTISNVDILEGEKRGKGEGQGGNRWRGEGIGGVGAEGC